jgi:hypothetical protein
MSEDEELISIPLEESKRQESPQEKLSKACRR